MSACVCFHWVYFENCYLVLYGIFSCLLEESGKYFWIISNIENILKDMRKHISLIRYNTTVKRISHLKEWGLN